MDAGNKFWWFAAVSILITGIVIAGIAVFFWQQLSPEDQLVLLRILKDHFIYIFVAMVLLLAAVGFGLDAIFNSYIIPLKKLAEEIDLIHSVNPSRRIRREGSLLVNRLIDALNEAADRYEHLQDNVQAQVFSAKADAERERSILAGIMAQIPEGVLICNPSGRILFYNSQARRQFSADLDGLNGVEREETPVGLGRSVFDFMDRSVMTYALEDLREKLDRNGTNAVSHFVAVSESGRHLRTEVVPILNQQKHFNGFILIFHDITDQLETDCRADGLLRSLTGGIRSSLAGIRSSSEVLLEFPEMDRDRLIQFSSIVHEESLKIGHMLSRYSLSFPERPVCLWPRANIPARSLVEKIQSRARQMLDTDLELDLSDANLVVSVDSYAIMLAALLIMELLKEKNQTRSFGCRVDRSGGYVAFDLTWSGAPVTMDTLRQWGEKVLNFESQGNPLTLTDVLRYHDGEMWPIRAEAPGEQVGLRLILPDVVGEQVDTHRDLAIVPDSRPEFYDFDLFHQPGQVPELDNQPLSRLTYTIFDTETTGLNPSAGDEIISIGAVRIVNNRLLTEERFEQLIKPKQKLSWESIQIHGIVDDMLLDQPSVSEVLPRFHRFVRGTVLVAHNAAFDMRLLQLREDDCRVRFTNPVLDTMLLSAVVHPAHDNHNLTAIARRLGVDISGRHTAIGDAFATGEILLKLIPLLAKKGVHTLKEARDASQKTYYARLRY